MYKSVNQHLIDAFVPESEQSYKVLENWVWTRLEYLCIYIQRGKSPKYSELEEIPVISQKCIQWTGFDLSKARFIDPTTVSSYAENRFIQPMDLLWNSTGTGTIGRINCYPEDFSLQKVVADSHVTVIRPMKERVLSKYLLYWLSSPHIQNKIDSLASGTTKQIELNTTTIKRIPVPLPPLKEQQRIVHNIESLFIKLDKAKDLIKEVRQDFENRKAAIMAIAFRGELTAKWREEKREIVKTNIECRVRPFELPPSWTWVKLEEVTSFIGSGITPRGGQASYSQSGVPFVRSQNVLKGTLNLNDVAYISEEINNSMERSKLKGGETLLNITGASIGRAARVPDNFKNGNVNQHVCIIRFKSIVFDELPVFWLNSPVFQAMIQQIQIGATRQALNYKQIRNMYLPLPPINEQKEIVFILNKIFKEESKIEELTQLEDQIEIMKETILAIAFHGKLSSNNPVEENARELLNKAIKRDEETMLEMKEVEVYYNQSIKKKKNIVEKVKKLPSKDLLKFLKAEPLTPRELYKLTELDIDTFYEVLKQYVESGYITEIRKDNEEVVLEEKNENQ